MIWSLAKVLLFLLVIATLTLGAGILLDTGGGLLLVPQFTLAADPHKGLRPSFTGAAPPELGRRLFDYAAAGARRHPP